MRGITRVLICCGLLGALAAIPAAAASATVAGPAILGHAQISGPFLHSGLEPFALTPAVANPPINTSGDSGWATFLTTDTTTTTTFAVTKPTCTSTESGFAPGSFIFGPATNDFDAAVVLVQCFNGALQLNAALVVGATQTTFANKIAVGDKITTTVSVGSSGTTVTIQDLAPKRAFTQTLTGSDTTPSLELDGILVLSDSITGDLLPIPATKGVSFTATDVNGSPMGAQTPTKVVWVDGCSAVLMPGAFDAATKLKFHDGPPAVNITSLTPASGTTGTSVAVAGSGFNSTSKVKFGGSVAATTVTHDSATLLHATVPNAAVTGPVAVQNTAAPVGTITSACAFAVTPKITSFSPASGITGSTVTINGSGLRPSPVVKFGTKRATITLTSANVLEVTVPNGAVAGPITVTTPAGTATTATNFTPTLAIKSFTPASGPSGTTVTINGVGFAGAPTVHFNGVASTTVSRVSSTVVKATVPTTASTGPITLTNGGAPAGTVTSAANYTVTPHVAPTVTGFTPTSGPAGTVVTITGTNFSGATSVKFGGVAAPTRHVDSPTQITATVPAGAVTGPISVTTAAGTGTSSTSFTVTA